MTAVCRDKPTSLRNSVQSNCAGMLIIHTLLLVNFDYETNFHYSISLAVAPYTSFIIQFDGCCPLTDIEVTLDVSDLIEQ